MRPLTTFILFLFSSLIFSQTIDNTSPSQWAGVLDNVYLFNGGGTIFNKPNKIKGNVYAFEKWNNRGVIRIDNKDYRLDNINFNMKTNNFESKVGKDSIFILDEKNIEYLFINSRKFKSLFVDKKNNNQSFEIVYDSDGLLLMKGYEIGIRYGKPDPTMVRETEDKYFTTTRYYVKEGNVINEISLKKKNILALFNEKSAAVSGYVKKNKLSYKKDRDLNRIFKYYESL